MTDAAAVLVVDDDPAVSVVLTALLEQAGLQCHQARDAKEALRALRSAPIDIVISDVRMPGMSGMDLLPEIRRQWPDIPVIMLTAHGSVPVAVSAMQLGAADFILKPFDREELLFVIRKALATTEQIPTSPVTTYGDGATVIGRSPSMRGVLALVERVGPTDSTVLLRGESGTGKEVIARAVHHRSKRNEGPFVAIRCAAIPDNLLESELFGYEKGAFTGATCRKPGKIELGQGGTVFLDEIGDLSAAMQVKLLHVLQERQLERLGGRQTVKVDVRFLAATHRDLDAMVAENNFREDLFYRLNVVPITLPPLRERGGDVGLLADSFFAHIAAANDRTGWTLAPAAVELLQREAWPGNVRQLHNFVERLVILSDGPQVGPADVERELVRERKTRPSLQGGARLQEGATPPGPQNADDERRVLEETLARCDDNRSKAARVLGISRRTLYNRMQKHGLID